MTRCTSAGMNGHISKPVRVHVLRDTIATWGATARGQSPAGSAHSSTTAQVTKAAVLFDEAIFAEMTEGLPGDVAADLITTRQTEISNVNNMMAAGLAATTHSDLQTQVHRLVSASAGRHATVGAGKGTGSGTQCWCIVV